MVALAEQVPLPPSVEDVEAMAWRRAVTLAGELGLQDVVRSEERRVGKEC